MARHLRLPPPWAALASLVALAVAQEEVAAEEAEEVDPVGSGYLAGPSVGPDGAFPDCPCTRSPALILQGNGERGSRCDTWNSRDGGICNQSEVPTWCRAKWCYVDRARCKRLQVTSEIDPAVSYSYETCGDLGSHYIDWMGLPLDRRLGRPLRVWAAGFKVGTFRRPRQGMNLDLRATLTFAGEVLARLGVDVTDEAHMEYHDLSAVAMARNPKSRYTACVYDIALGNLDLCIGPVWDTDERRAMNVSFTGTVFVEEMSLLMPDSERVAMDLHTIFFKTFEPFSFGLWVLILLCLGLSCLAMVVFEHWLTPTAAVASLQRQSTLGTTVTSWFLSFLAGEVTFMPSTSGGKVFSVGYGFFVLVCISCYTANMATILIGQDQNPSRIDSIADALKAGRRVCYHSALPVSTARAMYPGLDDLGRAVDGSKAGLQPWLDSGCEVCILSESMMADEWANRRSCGWFLKRRPVMSVPNGFYSSNALAHEFSWMASKLRLDGTWDRILNEVKLPSLCGASGRSDSSQLNASHMMGAIVVLLLCFVAGALVHIWELFRHVDCCVPSHGNSEDEDDEASDRQLRLEARAASKEARGALPAEAAEGLARLQLQLQGALLELEELRGNTATPQQPAVLQPLFDYFGSRSSRQLQE